MSRREGQGGQFARRVIAAPAKSAQVVALLCLVVTALFLTALPAPGYTQVVDEGIREAKNQIKQLEFEKEQVQRRLRDFHVTESETLDEIRALSELLREVKWRERHLISRRKAQLRRSRRQAVKIRGLTEQVVQSRARVGRHLRRLYRLSKTGDSATLIALARYKDFFKDVHYLSLIIETDRKEIEKHERLNRELANEQDKVQNTLARLAELNGELGKERSQLKKGQAALKNSLDEMRKNRDLYKKYLGELDDLRQGMETALVRMERNARAKKQATQVSDPQAMRGSLPPPTTGSIIAAFGQQDPRYKLKKFQRGVVIRVDEASPVNAVAPGKVVHAGPFRGYQQLVVLDHGKGLFSVYGHLEKLAVKSGGVVSSGMRLGAATYQPVGKDYDVYFEIRWQGKAVDPIKWLRPGSY